MGVHQADFACAQQRVGSTPFDRARWLLDFCQRDFQSAVGCQDQVEVLVFIGGDSQTNLPSENQIRSWQQYVNGVLRDLAGGDQVELVGKFIRRLSLRKGVLTVEEKLKPSSGGYRPFKFLAWETLASAGNRLRGCANQKCDHLFVREGKQGYCSVPCREATTKRNYRARKKAKSR